MRFRVSIVSKAKRLFTWSPPPEEKPVNWGNPVAEFDYKSQHVDYGNKEETFFDSRAWLDSDCEDDFYSVNGDFTPSRGSTPNYQFSNPATPQPSRTYFADTEFEPSPTERKKKLADLLEEKLQSEVRDELNSVGGKVEINGKPDTYKLGTDLPPKPLHGTSYLSGASPIYSSEATPVGDPNLSKEKTRKTKHCCLPNFIPSLGFSDKRKPKMSPER